MILGQGAPSFRKRFYSQNVFVPLSYQASSTQYRRHGELFLATVCCLFLCVTGPWDGFFVHHHAINFSFFIPSFGREVRCNASQVTSLSEKNVCTSIR